MINFEYIFIKSFFVLIQPNVYNKLPNKKKKINHIKLKIFINVGKDLLVVFGLLKNI